jgi:hypothetical protein
MIDRKALWISLLLVFAMIAADFWRLSLLPDWHHMPVNGPGDGHTINGLFVFRVPCALLFMMFMFFARKWFISGPEESVGAWRRWSGTMTVFSAVMMALAQAFMLARSLGTLQSIDRLTLSHIVFAATGIFMMVVGNMMPKMPFLTARFRPFRLDPWQWNRHLRFGGKLTVVVGLFFAVGMPLLSVKMILPASIGLALTMIAVNLWHHTKVKRERSVLP